MQSKEQQLYAALLLIQASSDEHPFIQNIANKVSRGIPGSIVLTGDTEKSLRAQILAEFKKGKIRCVVNVGVLTTGFDYPELEATLIARSTMSLALYYQIVGRVMRPHPLKESAWVVDLGGNIQKFGKIETM